MTYAHTSRSPRSRAFRGAPWLLVAAVTALGCSGEITVLGDEGGEGRPGLGDPGDAACTTGGASAQPDPAPLALTDVKSGAFFGDTLHLEATVDGTPRYVVLHVDADGVARAVAMPDELLGPANLAESAPGVHARLRVDGAGVPNVDVVDTSDPGSPWLISSAAQGGTIDGPAVFSAGGGHLFFCLRPPGAETAELTSVDLTDPEEPSSPGSIESFLCYFHKDNMYSTSGDAWISWNQPTGTWVQQVYLHTVAPEGADALMDLGYNQTGVHQYGNVSTAALSPERAVFDPENKSLFLLATTSGDPTTVDNPPFAWATFTVGAERHLVGVADTTVYLETDESVRAYDIADILAPELLPYEAVMAPHEGALRTLATSPRYLAVVDEKGTLFLLPRESPGGVVEPLVVHAAGYEPPPGEAACPE